MMRSLSLKFIEVSKHSSQCLSVSFSAVADETVARRVLKTGVWSSDENEFVERRELLNIEINNIIYIRQNIV